MLKSGITKRWIVTTILVIALILTMFSCIIIRSIKNNYYASAEKKLQSLGQSNTLSDYFTPYLNSTNDVFIERAREYVENFNEINIAEVWVLNRFGDVMITSTGFEAQTDNGEDYQKAVESPSGRGIDICFLSSGEKVMALTVLLPKTNESLNGAVRYMISLQDVDHQLSSVTVITMLGCLFALLLVIGSGLFFVHSIVAPVKKLNLAAQEIAKGNFSVQLEKPARYDEIAELTRSISDMTEGLAKTDRLKNEFISTVSHELRTPLTAIKGWTETLISLDNSGDPTLLEGLKVIQNESERLYSLVEDLLDFSRMENGKMTMRIQKIDALAELDEAVYVLRDRAARERKELFYSSPDFPAPMDGDPDRIKQVFVNIIDNSIKYTPPGGRIAILACLTSNYLKVSIADTGCGISEKDLPHVKEKFYKANANVKGSGIGLAVCDEIVSLHGGTIKIKSIVDRGTEVIVSLPLTSVNLGQGKENQYE